jgi:pilus assembly protein CpaE
MSSKSGVLLFTGEARTERAVLSAIDGTEPLEPVSICHGLEDLTVRLEERPSPLAIVDIDPRPADLLKELERLVSRFRETRFVVLSTELRNDLVLEAMQAGARHFLLKESIGDSLVGVLQRLSSPNGGSGDSRGNLVTLLSASGGAGSTTLAVNLANELQIATGEDVLLVDLDTAYGAVANYLDLRGPYSVADLLSGAQRPDAALIRSTALRYSERMHVLLSPASIRFGEPAALDFAGLDDLVKSCRLGYSSTVFDAPRIPADAAASLARASKLTLLVFQLTVKDLRFAKALWAGLMERGVQKERVLGVVNRFRRRRQMVTLGEVEKALPDMPVMTVANDFRAAIQGLNYGQPLSNVARRSALRRAVQELATRVAQPVSRK